MLELIALLRFPMRPNFVGELRWRVEISAREVENERSRDDAHFNDQQLVIRADELRDVEAKNFRHARFFQSEIHVALAFVHLARAMHFYRDVARFSIAFRCVHNTVNAVTQPLGEPELVPASIRLCVLSQEFVHD